MVFLSPNCFSISELISLITGNFIFESHLTTPLYNNPCGLRLPALICDRTVREWSINPRLDQGPILVYMLKILLKFLILIFV